MKNSKNIKVVITGGPGGGKTTALDLFRRELSHDVAVVPEAASILFQGGLPRSLDPSVLMCTQKAIFQLQRSLESIQAAINPKKLLICDRGTLDGQAYWPEESGFFEYMQTSFEEEISNYDAVIFFETAASNGNSINSNNPVRTESLKEAVNLDKKLQKIWSNHPNYHFVPSSQSFVKKIMFGIMTIENVIEKCRRNG